MGKDACEKSLCELGFQWYLDVRVWVSLPVGNAEHPGGECAVIFVWKVPLG